jgi:hypothetical protein
MIKKILKHKKVIVISALTSLIAAAIIFVATGGMIHVYRFLFDPSRDTVPFDFNIRQTADFSDTITREEAIEDIDYILRLLRTRHPAAMRGLPEAVAEQSRTEKENFSEEVTVLELWQAAARILALMDDSHTYVLSFRENHLPDWFRFTDGILYRSGGEFDGVEVISIGGVSVDELYRTFKAQYSYERVEWAECNFPYAVRWKEILVFLHADVSEEVVIVYKTADGEVTREYGFIERDESEEEDEDDDSFVFYEIDRENNVGIFTFTRCKYNDIYREALENFFTEVKENEIQTVVVDLRYNGGGKAGVVNEFIRYLDVDRYYMGIYEQRLGPVLWQYGSAAENDKADDLLFSGDVYVLTSVWTFSAATIFSAIISDNNLGKIVGETSGQPPSFYGGSILFQTPNAEMLFAVSWGYISRPDESKPNLLIPDYPSSPREALETVYEILQ